MESDYPVLEHRERRTGRWLRGNRLLIAFLIALVETVLVVTDVIGWYSVLAIAAVLIGFYVVYGRRARWPWLRQLSWTAAVSQLLPVLVPFAALAVATVVLVGLVAAIVIIVAFLVFGRR